jgi:hypothetical protein
VTGDGIPTLRRIHEPGPERASQSRGCREGNKPRKSRRSLRRHVTLHTLRDFEGQGSGCARCPKAKGVGVAAERRFGPVPTGPESAERSNRVVLVW